jgi:tetratricopeptide (TPR) repeat protein
LKKGNDDRAIADYDQALKLDPNYALAYNNRGNAHFVEKNYDRAIADYDQAIRIDPLPGVVVDERGRTSTNVYNNRGYVYFANKDYARALADYDRAIRVDPKDPLTYNNRGLAYTATRDFDRAIADFGEAIQLDRKYSLALNNRGIAYYAKRDHDRLAPANAAGWSGRCWSRAIVGQLDQALADCNEAHLSFLRGFAEFHYGIPCADWLRTVMNRINPDLFMACFSSWVAECWPDKLDLVAIDGKTSRRSHNRKTGQKPLHLVSAFATNSRLVLGQEADATRR